MTDDLIGPVAGDPARSGGDVWVGEAVGIDLGEHHRSDLQPARRGREAGGEHPPDAAEPTAVDHDQRQSEVGGEIGIEEAVGEGGEEPSGPFHDQAVARLCPLEHPLAKERLVDHPPLGSGSVVGGKREGEGLRADG